MLIALTLLAAAVVGFGLEWLNVPGGLIIGGMVGAAVVTLAGGVEDLSLPRPLVTGAYVVLGAQIGTSITREFIGDLGRVAIGAVLSAAMFIALGLAVAWLLGVLGIAPEGSILATSPGALTVMSAAAEQQGTGPQVAVFHLVRLVLVILSLPLLIRLSTQAG